MTNPHDFEGNNRFTWIPFYMELAEKLLKYKDKRDELLEIVYGMDETYISFFNDDKKQPFQDLHPFALYGIFNRNITEKKRQDICLHLKKYLKLESNLPVDFDSIPLMNNQKSWWGMPWTKNDAIEDITVNWKIFEVIQNDDLDIENFVNYFDYIRSRGGAKWNLTMALFWVRPHDFIPLDTNSREYLAKIGIEVFDEKNLTAENYLNLIKKIKSKIENNEIKEKSFPEISFNAWKKDAISTGDPTMTQDNTLLDKYTKLLKNTHNLILTGAPGTGKTYLARQIAQAMGCSSQEIGFVQFHPSYDYTDFVEGLRPVQDESGSGQIGFERKDGVFKEFCARALKNLVDSRKSESELKSELSLKEKIDAFLLKAKENGDKFYTSKENVFFIKTYNEKKVVVMYKTKDGTISDTVSIKYSDLEKLLKENRKIERSEVKLLTGRAVERQEDSYSSVLINNMLAEPSECIVVKENNIELKNFVFIIDEINRGEVSKIFGELFYSVDPSYRVSVQELEAVRANEKQLATIKTQYANLETDGNDFDRALNSADYGHFFIPENVFIIGTMNDIDRSVESMDFAFRRRFTWVEVKAEDTQYMLDEKVDENGQTQGLPSNLAQEAKERMNRLNKAIDEIRDLNSAYHIGASYFLKLKEYGGDFEKLWEYHLKGLLREYLRGSGNEATGMESLQKAYFGEEERLDQVYFHSNQEQ